MYVRVVCHQHRQQVTCEHDAISEDLGFSFAHKLDVANVHVLRLQMSLIVLALTEYLLAIKLLFPFSKREAFKQDPKSTGFWSSILCAYISFASSGESTTLHCLDIFGQFSKNFVHYTIL